MFGLSSSTVFRAAATFVNSRSPIFKIPFASYDLSSLFSVKRYLNLLPPPKYGLEYYLTKSCLVKDVPKKDGRSVFEIINSEKFTDRKSPLSICLRIMEIVAKHDDFKKVPDEEFIPYCEQITRIVYKALYQSSLTDFSVLTKDNDNLDGYIIKTVLCSNKTFKNIEEELLPYCRSISVKIQKKPG